MSNVIYTYPRKSINSGLIHHWKLDEDGGLVAVNTVNSSFNGTLTGMTGDERVPAVDKTGLATDGVNDYVTCGLTPGISGVNQFAVGLYFKADFAQASNGYMASKDAASDDRSFSFHLRSADDMPRIHTFIGGGSTTITLAAITFGVWYHLLVSYNGKQQHVYLNGELEDTEDITGLVDASTANFEIGSRRGGSNNFWGTLDDVRVYNRSLSAGEAKVFGERLLVA